MLQTERPPTDERIAARGRRVGWLALGGGALVVVYWALYATDGIAMTPGLLDALEPAFVLPDALLAVTLFAASRALLTGRKAGPLLLVVGSSMCLYLGVLDATLYARHGASPLALAIVAVCVGGGALGLRIGWTLWRDAWPLRS